MNPITLYSHWKEVIFFAFLENLSFSLYKFFLIKFIIFIRKRVFKDGVKVDLSRSYCEVSGRHVDAHILNQFC